jgi:3-oxoadipate enol-lactonase
MPYLERKGKPTIHYELDDFTDPWRKAPIIILQHGFGRSSRFWYSWVPYLSRFFRVVRPDLRGLGQSSADFDLAKDLTVDNYIEDLVAIIDALNVDSVHYCGESLGGILGMVLAAERPDRVRTLSLIAAPLYIHAQGQKTFAFGYSSWAEALRQLGSTGWSEKVNSTTRFPAETDPGLQRWYAEEMGKSRVEVLAALSGLASKVNVTPYLSRIKAPVLGLYPSSDPLTDQEQENLMLSRIPKIKIVHLPSRYHTIQNTAPASCATHVLYFAAQHEGMACHE